MVLNKDLIKTKGIVTKNLISGRAIMVQRPWHSGATFTWLAVYTPNNENKSKGMLETLTQMWDDGNLPNMDRMSSNFNLIEDTLDCLPIHENNRAAVNTFTDFHRKLKLRDGWRTTYPKRKNYTFTRMSGNFLRSCIDRIYFSETQLKDCKQWNILNWVPRITISDCCMYSEWWVRYEMLI